jgi:hypothetical protein
VDSLTLVYLGLLVIALVIGIIVLTDKGLKKKGPP